MDSFTKITVLENEIQAQLLSDTLKERSIPHTMHNYYDAVFDGMYQAQKGWGHIEAPEKYREEILNILEGLKPEADDNILDEGDGEDNTSDDGGAEE